MSAKTAAEGCPGVESEKAGKESVCAGCPNQQICASGTASKSDPAREIIIEKLKDVHKILILSGKGGVGKSTFTTLFARTLAQTYEKYNFGVLDIDICGPSQPRMFGVRNEIVHQSGYGWSPVFIEENLSLMSIGFLLSSPDDAIIWRGPKKNGMIRQFLNDVDWGDINFLIIDTPPGTSDEHLSSVSYIGEPIDKISAVILTTPHDISLLDVRKEITFCRKVKIPICGVIENMSIFYCNHCNKSSEIFPSKIDGTKKMCEEMNVDYLGTIPLDQKIANVCDVGGNLNDITDETMKIVQEICDKIMKKILKKD